MAKNSPSMCLFCVNPASQSDPLHDAMTKMISEIVKRCAMKILDEELLEKVYRDRFTQMSVSSPSVHSTRLKDRILANFPELQAFNILARAARIVCKDIMSSLMLPFL